jgi:phosphoglycolate phosphatase-like HAD superfamily hydrolase
MSSFFTMVQGAPLDKAGELSSYLSTCGLCSEDVLFFGDTSEDAAAAAKAGWPFVAVADPEIREDAAAFINNFKSHS